MKLATKSVIPYLVILVVAVYLFFFATYKEKEKVMADSIKNDARITTNELARLIAAEYPTTTMDTYQEKEIIEFGITQILQKYLQRSHAAYAAVSSRDRNVTISVFNDAYDTPKLRRSIFVVKDVMDYKYEQDIEFTSDETLYEFSVLVIIPKTYYKELTAKESVLILSERESKKYNFPEFIEQLAFIVKYAVTLKNVKINTIADKKLQIPAFVIIAFFILAIIYRYEEYVFKPLSKLIIITKSLKHNKDFIKHEIKRRDEFGVLSKSIFALHEDFLKSINDLRLSNDYTQSLISTSNISSLFNIILRDILKLKRIEKGGLLYWNERRKRFVVKETNNFNDVHKLIGNDTEFVQWFLENRTVLDPEDYIKHFNDYNKKEAQRWRQYGIELIIPMFKHDKVVGLINLGKLRSLKEYSEEDIEFLKSISQVAVIAIENLNLRLREAQNLIIRKDLNFARSVQKKLLPGAMPDVSGAEFAVNTSPARNIGGDYYDFISLTKDTIGIGIADVSGKGVPAALVMASTRSYLRLIAKDNFDCSEILHRLNTLLIGDTGRKMFVTMFYSILDMNKNKLHFANAGHNFPFIYKAKESASVHMEAKGFPLGMMDDFVFKSSEATFEKGDMIVFYTDGIVEAVNDKKEFFGFDRLENTLNKFGSLSVDEFLKRFMREFKDFIGDEELFDDYTIMAVKIK